MSARSIPAPMRLQTMASLNAGCLVTFHNSTTAIAGQLIIVTTACIHHPVGRFWVAASDPKFMEILQDISDCTL